MARVVADEVIEIMPTTKLTNLQIEAYIKVANLVVTEHLTTCGLSDAELKEIERWLTAHLIKFNYERQAKSEKLGEASITYQGSFGEGLNATSYGKTVMMLDTCGELGRIGKRTVKIGAITSFE